MSETEQNILGAVTILPEIIQDTKKSVKNISSFEKKIEEYLSQNTTNLLDVVLFGALTLLASDIHIEPEKEKVKLRVRMDGVLQDVCFVEHNIYHNLLSRIKLLSKVKLNITDKPQDGRFTIAAGKSLIEIRTSTLPAEYGEAVVMRF